MYKLLSASLYFDFNIISSSFIRHFLARSRQNTIVLFVCYIFMSMNNPFFVVVVYLCCVFCLEYYASAIIVWKKRGLFQQYELSSVYNLSS